MFIFYKHDNLYIHHYYRQTLICVHKILYEMNLNYVPELYRYIAVMRKTFLMSNGYLIELSNRFG